MERGGKQKIDVMGQHRPPVGLFSKRRNISHLSSPADLLELRDLSGDKQDNRSVSGIMHGREE